MESFSNNWRQAEMSGTKNDSSYSRSRVKRCFSRYLSSDIKWAIQDSNKPQNHEEKATSEASRQFVDSVVDLNEKQTAELLALWQPLAANERTELLAIARRLQPHQQR